MKPASQNSHKRVKFNEELAAEGQDQGSQNQNSSVRKQKPYDMQSIRNVMNSVKRYSSFSKAMYANPRESMASIEG